MNAVFADFLPVTVSCKEAALVIVDSEADAQRAARELEAKGYAPLEDVGKLASPGRYLLALSANNARAVYELISQYPTGQISAFDDAAHSPRFISPAYRDSSFVLVAPRRALEAAEEAGFPVRTLCGPAVRL